MNWITEFVYNVMLSLKENDTVLCLEYHFSSMQHQNPFKSSNGHKMDKYIIKEINKKQVSALTYFYRSK